MAKAIKTTQTVAQPAIAAAEIFIGEFVGFDTDQQPLVAFDSAPQDTNVALTLAELTEQHIGKRVALQFVNASLEQPMIMGVIRESRLEDLVEFQTAEPESATQTPTLAQRFDPIQASVDDERLTLTAQQEITLKCGKASITLTRAGKILIRGAYLSSRSSGVNRIKGGSVQIN